jgi:hypothetical protein
MPNKVVFKCIDEKSGDKLNAMSFSTKFKPGYCFGMSIDWARTSLKRDGVKGLDMLDPGKWALIQSAYEINLFRQRGPDEVGAITANGLKVVNGGGNGEPVVFNKDFKLLARQLVVKVGTFIFILFGLPGTGAHFMGFRRKGVSRLLLAEFFDPNDALVSFDSEQEFEDYLGWYLDYMYNGKDPGDPTLNEFCGLSQVELA